MGKLKTLISSFQNTTFGPKTTLGLLNFINLSITASIDHHFLPSNQKSLDNYKQTSETIQKFGSQRRVISSSICKYILCYVGTSTSISLCCVPFLPFVLCSLLGMLPLGLTYPLVCVYQSQQFN